MRRGRDLIIIIMLTFLAVAVVYFSSQNQVSALPSEQDAADMVVSEVKVLPVSTLYDIPVSDYLIAKGEIHRGQSMSEVLLPLGVSPKQIFEISLLPDSLLDERRIKPGHMFTMLSTKDSIPAIFIYEKDPLNYVTVRLDSEPVSATNGVKPVEQRITTASGTIESSLWESMIAANANPMLAVELSEIFAWTIDFFGVQQGDRYKVLYEESYVDSQTVGINRIIGAWIYHNSTDFWAIPFEQDGVMSFFDENGNSLRKAFLKAPLRFSRISSGFSNSRYHPVLKIRRPHHGVDYAAPTGTPVHTVGDGVIIAVGYQKRGGGNYVKIKHNSVYSTTYMHLSKFGKGVKSGKYVKQGDVIGYVGATGLATGPHLDFRFYKNGSPVNPLKVEAPPVEPIHEENISAYRRRLGFTMNILKLI